MKSNGPNIDPWGTPYWIGNWSERTLSTAGDCLSMNCSVDHRKGNFKVDISGTKFLLPNTIPYLYTGYPECDRGVHKGLMSSDRWRGILRKVLA
jgi:hypothetical protein